MSDRWIKCISTQGNIRGVAVQAHDLLVQMAKTHELQGEGARRLGEAVIGALLIGSYCKEGERINLNIQGTGGVRQALIDAYPDGTVRGFVVERLHEDPSHIENLKYLSQFDSATTDGPWGGGIMSILRTKEGEGERPYIGTVPLLTGHLAKDLTFYWAQSEQIPSAVGIAVNLTGDQVGSAGGFLVQILPGASAEEVRLIERHINEIDSLAAKLAESEDPMSLLSQIFQDTAFVVVEERELEFKCNCSWDRVNRALALVGVDELRAMLKADNGAIVKCDFCSKEYALDAPRLREMIAKLEPGKGH